MHFVTFHAPVEDDVDYEPVDPQNAAGVDRVDPGLDGERQRRGQRSLLEMERPLAVGVEEAEGIDRADHPGDREEDRDDVVRRADQVGDVEPVVDVVGHEAAICRRLGISTGVAHADLRRIRQG